MTRIRGAVLASIAALAGATLLPPASPAAAQAPIRRGPAAPAARPPPPVAMSDDPADLRARFGVERAKHLVHSQDADERLRGIERAAGLAAERSPEAVALLVQQLDPSAPTRGDARAKIAVARGLASHVEQPGARAALLQIVELANPRGALLKAEAEDPLYGARLEVARHVAALALAQSGEAHAVEALVAVARGTTSGASAAMDALGSYPPSGSTSWARPMSAAMAKLVARTGDLRPRGALLEAARGTTLADAPAKAAAIEALGALGDARVLPIAVASLREDDPRVRTAATRALVAMGAPEAARAVEQLLADDATAGYGIDLAMIAHGPGVVHALAARGAIAADPAVRSAVVAALGRDPSADAIEALSALGRDPLLRADAADAIARSPSAAAMAAIERLGGASPVSRRLGARAYLVRTLVRGETSRAMEGVLADLVASTDVRDRALGAFARVVRGEAEATRWLDDPDPAVRRAAAMASLQRATAATRAALLARRAKEEDAPTRTVLGAGLLDGDPGGQLPTRGLLACARGGGADVPLCALALARRAAPAESAEVDLLLASRDPIVRAHAARGLAGSLDPTREGRLAQAYAYEPDPLVRRAIVRTLAAVPGHAPSVAATLAVAWRLDPDPEIRWMASHLSRVAAFDSSSSSSGSGRSTTTGEETSIAWIHLADPSGAPPASATAAANEGCQTGALLRPDGLAVPIAFDADGDALVPGVPPGTSRLVLAPRMDAAYAPSP